MTVVVARHGPAGGPDAESYAERLGAHLAKEMSRLEHSTYLIDSTFSTALLLVSARSVIDPRAAAVETWEAVVNAMQLGSALFEVTAVSEGTVEYRIDRKLWDLPAAGPMPSADAGNWLTAFWLAVVCRDQGRMTRLCDIPLERLRSPEGKIDGSFALGPLAIACLAYDGGFRIEVESEYLPKHLLERGWLGEFPT
ncbi:immunity 49 family protein [Streptomyces sp. NPDC006638]|uniref:immunity 49 family protein n=1 Tax=Streptomyces sp. NPDC006638 TaxID=3157183 RepID=UPI0033B8D1D4